MLSQAAIDSRASVPAEANVVSIIRVPAPTGTEAAEGLALVAAQSNATEQPREPAGQTASGICSFSHPCPTSRVDAREAGTRFVSASDDIQFRVPAAVSHRLPSQQPCLQLVRDIGHSIDHSTADRTVSLAYQRERVHESLHVSKIQLFFNDFL